MRQDAAHAHILAIGINDAAAYRTAACLGVDAVLADSPREMAAIRAWWRRSSCPALEQGNR